MGSEMTLLPSFSTSTCLTGTGTAEEVTCLCPGAAPLFGSESFASLSNRLRDGELTAWLKKL